ncbi:hypothetical protein OIE62_33085 [Streptomyces scopuliridis]|uniref:Uncharacterized protein n=1 Tax=Streptomyces scopuliridis TaxID=452529 RepID=A0ACD4ZGG9_9ACTN|nr:hypothetical protein [Streptomyces scopuliridis]WSB96921.1 hypothetical protein OG835_07850 [Streptomyces scopuliridis]WSC09375.1 hypothetical protein OIE62_33085 [Streptomyces scopuliridis]
MEWVPVVPGGGDGAESSSAHVVVATPGPVADEDAVAAAHQAARHALELVQRWLGTEPAPAERLLLVTRGAMAVRPDDGVADLAGATVWGLLRSTQSEHPGRFICWTLSKPVRPVRPIVSAASATSATSATSFRKSARRGKRLSRKAP